MSRRRNFLPLLGLVVCVAAWMSYPLFFVQFPVTRDVPWANWLLFAFGLTLTTVGLLRPFRQPERYRGRIASAILAVASLAVLGLFVFMREVESRRLPAAAAAPTTGEKVPDFTLGDANGGRVRLSDLLAPRAGASSGSWLLLIFYRGYW